MKQTARWGVAAVVGCAAMMGATAWAQGEAPPFDLSGRWAMVQDQVTVAAVPVVGEVRSTTRAVILFDLAQRQERLQGQGTLCALDVDSGSAVVDTVLPPAFLKVQPRPTMDARLKRDGERWRLKQRRTLHLAGAKLEDPRADALPTDPDDPRVVDEDKDGHPGVTVWVRGLLDGDIYLTTRSWSDFEGLVQDPKRVSGSTRFGQEQVILGTTSRFLDDPPEAKPDLNQSRFWLLRLDDAATCEDAKRAAGDL